MPFIDADKIDASYQTVVIGSGFGSFFFLHEFLKNRPSGRVLLIEWGAYKTHDWQVQNKANKIYDTETLYTHGAGERYLDYSVAFGGGTVCWCSQRTRNHPNYFQLKSNYAVGVDWPFPYKALAPY